MAGEKELDIIPMGKSFKEFSIKEIKNGAERIGGVKGGLYSFGWSLLVWYLLRRTESWLILTHSSCCQKSVWGLADLKAWFLQSPV